MTYENDHLSVFHVLHLYVVLHYKQRERKKKEKKKKTSSMIHRALDKSNGSV